MILDITLPIKEELGEDYFKFTQVEEMGDLLSQFISIAIAIAAILLLVYLIMSGIQWLTSGGEKTAVASARDRMTNAFIGLMIVLAAWAIFTLVQYLFGIPSGIEEGPPKPRPPCSAPYYCVETKDCSMDYGDCRFEYSCPKDIPCCCDL